MCTGSNSLGSSWLVQVEMYMFISYTTELNLAFLLLYIGESTSQADFPVVSSLQYLPRRKVRSVTIFGDTSNAMCFSEINPACYASVLGRIHRCCQLFVKKKDEYNAAIKGNHHLPCAPAPAPAAPAPPIPPCMADIICAIMAGFIIIGFIIAEMCNSFSDRFDR